MTKVEELRAVVYNDVAHYLLDCGHNENGEKEAADEIDSLIAAAKEEEAVEEHNLWLLQQLSGIPTTSYPPKAFPKTYGDALPIKETPCSG